MGKESLEKKAAKVDDDKPRIPGCADRGWLTVLAGFMANFCSSGINSVFGLLYVELERETGSDVLVLSWIGSLFIGFSLDSAPLVGILARNISYWSLAVCGGLLTSVGYFLGYLSTSLPVLYLGLGVLTGFGFGLSTFSAMMVVGETFTRKRPLALGICLAGVGAGTIVFPPVYTVLLEVYGIRGLFLITAGLFLNNAVFGVFLRSTKHKENPQVSSQSIRESLVNPNLVKSPKFIIFTLVNFLFTLSCSIPFTYIPMKTTEQGISVQLTALMISISGITSMTGRVVIGMIAGNVPRARPWLFFVFLVVSGLTLNVLPFAESYTPIALLALIFMLCTGACFSLVPVLLLDMFGTDLLTCSLSLTYFMYGIGSMIGVPVAASFCEAIGDNDWAFYVASFSLYLSSALMVLCNRLKTSIIVNQVDPSIKKIPDVESNIEAINISVIDLPEPVGPPAA